MLRVTGQNDSVTRLRGAVDGAERLRWLLWNEMNTETALFPGTLNKSDIYIYFLYIHVCIDKKKKKKKKTYYLLSDKAI